MRSPHPAGEASERRLTNRSIRSFVIRNGRLTAAQADALERLSPRYVLPFDTKSVHARQVFGRRAPLWLEIGFGNGDALLDMAAARPEVDFIGCEVHAPGVGHALRGIETRALDNVRIVQHDALEVLEHMVAPASLDRVLLFFPDPWHKKRHHKRRIVQDDFLGAVARALGARRAVALRDRLAGLRELDGRSTSRRTRASRTSRGPERRLRDPNGVR